MAIKRGSKIDGAFSAASMTDLMFLLLFFMLITTTMVNPYALRVMLPKSTNQINERAFTTVSISSDLNYYIEDTPVGFDELESALRVKLEGVDTPTISLHCDRTVPVEELVKLMNIAIQNHYRLILATSPTH